MTNFEWQCYPEAEKWLYAIIESYKEHNSFIGKLEKELISATSTLLFDWIDHISLKFTEASEQALLQHGFELESAMPSYRIFTHFGAKFPTIVLQEEGKEYPAGIFIKVESIADFLLMRGEEKCIEGSPFSPYRRCLVHQEKGVALFAIERRGSRSFEPAYMPESYLDDYLTLVERWQSRPRYGDEKYCLQKALALAEESVALIGKDTAAWIVLECERRYWQARNLAAQIQKNRQDRLGMGWANHDHHTFRSSRTHFHLLVRLFETLGFHCRERYYAGNLAGWGAQIMENQKAGIVLFLDVDLAPHEIEIDFAHHPLQEQDHLGTVGLWCALHGDSILKGGMHHLEAQFLFDHLKEDLSNFGIGLMNPFSHFSYLKQAFTQGEKWKVDPQRIEMLVSKGLITYEQADRFLKEGAVGSHLENLQRREGYKGFNKENVNLIIKETDPRSLTF